MLNNIIRISFAVVGGITGFTLTKTFMQAYTGFPADEIGLLIYTGISGLAAFLFYSAGNKMIKAISKHLDNLEGLIQGMTLYELTISSVGLIIGLIIANLITIPIVKVSIIGVPVSIMANVLFGCLGVYIAAGKRNESLSDFFKDRNYHKHSCENKIIDTSALIDGRIADIIRCGFIEGSLIIPSFVLTELRHIADSQDSLKRNRGRRGLDVINMIRNELNYPVKIDNTQLPEGEEVDSELLKIAKRLNGCIITTDFNLNKVASVQNIPVLNVNELANAVKPIALPGEKLEVHVIKDGKENGQGIGYMDDGTMIVVDGGQSQIGKKIDVVVTSVLQTAAGRMIFAKPKITADKVV